MNKFHSIANLFSFLLKKSFLNVRNAIKTWSLRDENIFFIFLIFFKKKSVLWEQWNTDFRIFSDF
jgi:hypothetical protein